MGASEYAAGKFGTALAFNGQYTYSADIPSGSVLTTMTLWTSSIWINIPSANIGNQQSMVMARYSGGVSANDGNGFEMGYDPGGGGVWVAVLNTGNSWAWYGDMPATISPDTWTMVTTTVTAAGINLYIDGVQVGATQGLTQSGGTPMFTQAGNDISIGYTKSLGGCSASLDEFDLFSSVLSGGQITQLYTNQLSTAGSLPSTTPLQIAAGTAFDLNGNGQTVASLSDVTLGSGGIVTNSGTTAATLTLAASDGNSTTFSGTIQNGSPGSQTALTLNGNGTQVLAGTNTYSGPTTITAGTLQAGSNTGLSASSAVVIGSSGVLDVGGYSPTTPSLSGNGLVTNSGAAATLTLAPTGGNSATFSGVIEDGTGAGGQTSLTLNGNGTQVLAGPNTYSGLTTITAGTLQIGDGVTGSFGSTSGFVTGAGGIVAFNLPGTNTLTTPVSGSGGLQQVGGTLVLGGVAAYSGPTVISGGTLQVSAASPTPLVHYTLNGTLGGSVNSGATIADVTGHGYTATMNGNGATFVAGPVGQGIQFTGGQIIATPFVAQLTSWTDSFWVNMSSAILTNGNAYCLMSGRGYSGDALGYDTYYQYSGGQGYIGIEIPGLNTGWIASQLTNPVSLAGDQWTLITQTVSLGQYQLYIDGRLAGTQSFRTDIQPELMHSPAYLSLGGWGTGNQFVGGMADFNLFNGVLSGTQIQQLYLGNPGTLPAASGVQIGAAGVLDLAGNNQTVASLSDITLGSGGVVTNSVGGSVTLTIAPPAGSTTFSGVIQNGAGQTSLTLYGQGTQVLAGTNTYSGLTTINAGTLQFGNGAAGSVGNTSGFLTNGMLAFSLPGTATVSQDINGSGGLQQMGPGVLALASPYTNYSGPTIVSGGTLQGGVGGYQFNFSGSSSILSGATVPNNAIPAFSGTMHGTGASYVAGPGSSTAIQFTGSQVLQSSTGPGALNTFTISFWAETPDTGGPTGVVMWDGRGFVGDTAGSRELWYGDDGWRPYLQIGSTTPGQYAYNTWMGEAGGVPFPWPPSGNEWFLTTITVEPGQIEVYVNGQLINTYPITLTPQFQSTGSPVEIGGNVAQTSFFTGSIADFAVYNSFLSAAQVATLYNTGLGPVSGNLSPNSPVQMGAGVLDLGGNSQTVLSLSDYGSGGGVVTNNGAAATLTLAAHRRHDRLQRRDPGRHRPDLSDP